MNNLAGFRALTAALAAAFTPVVAWLDRSPLPEGVSGGALAWMTGNKLVYAGGTSWKNQVKHWLRTTLVYDIRTDSWTDGPSLPEPLAYGAYLRNANSLEVLGGFNDSGPSLKCWRLSEGEKTWTPSGELPEPKVLAKAETVRGKAYLFGGCPDATDLSRCSETFLRREASGHWTSVGEMPQGRVAMPATAVVRSQIYLFGGCSANGSGGVLNRSEAYRYDPKSNRWSALHPLPHASRGITAIPVNDRYILLAGGYEDGPPGFSAVVYLYDLAEDRYLPATPLPFPVMTMEAVGHGSTVWGVGGEDKNRSRSPRVLEGTFSR